MERRCAYIAVSLAVLLLTAVAGAEPVRWTNDADVTKKVASHFEVEPIVVISVAQRTTDPLDVLVTMWAARQGGLNPLRILDKRVEARHWSSILSELQVPTGPLFEGITPAMLNPDFRHAALEWERSAPQGPNNLYDNEIRHLAGIRFVAEALKISPAEVLGMRSEGKTYWDMVLSPGLAPTLAPSTKP